MMKNMGFLLAAVGALSLAPLGASAQEAVQAGVSAAVRGDVQVARADTVGRQVVGGDPIFLRDAITSGSESGMQILLLDETVFTIGPESEMEINEFVYDPASGDGSLGASLTKGVMRFVTGNISDGNPESMTIKLPVGTIGIRGTRGAAAVLSPQQAEQQFPGQFNNLGTTDPGAPVVFAALSGPGPLTQTDSDIGSFNFSTPEGSVDLNRPGAAVLASPGAPPIFFIAPPGSIQDVFQIVELAEPTSPDFTEVETDSTDIQEGLIDEDSAEAEPEPQDGVIPFEVEGTPADDTGDSFGGVDVATVSGVNSDSSFQAVDQLTGDFHIASQVQSFTQDVDTATGGALTFVDLAGFSGSVSFNNISNVGPANLTTTSFSIGFSARDIFFQGTVNGVNVHTGALTATSVSWASLSGNAIFKLGQDGGSFQNIESNSGCASCTVSIAVTSNTGVSITATDSGGNVTETTMTGSN